MNEYMKKRIIGDNYHQFLYGYNTLERTNFLKEIAMEHPITLNRNCPQAIYMDNFSLPTLEYIHGVDKNQLEIVSRDYFDFCVYTQLIEELLKTDYEKELSGREEQFLKYINAILVNPGFSEVESLISLREIFIKARDFYQQTYVSTITGSPMETFYQDLVISDIFMQDEYMREFKAMINNSSYFALIIDQKEKMPIVSQKAINGYVNRRINSDISMKVACDINDWMTYSDVGGLMIENLHDYIYVELDSNSHDYLEQRKKEFYKKYSI